MCMETVSIKLCRSKGRPPNTHTHTHTLSIIYTTLLIPPPYLPLHSFNRAIACSNFFQMSSTSLPPLPCSTPSILNSHRLEVLPPLLPSLCLSLLSPRASTYWSQRQNMTPEGQPGEAGALPKQKGMPKQMRFPHCTNVLVLLQSAVLVNCAFSRCQLFAT